MRRGLAWSALLLLAGSAARAEGPTFGSPSGFTEQGGAAVYGSVCAACHMANGQGAVGGGAYPALAGDARLAGSAYPLTVVLHGRHAMPGFGRWLSDEQAAAVVGYIRTSFGNDYPGAPTAADAAALR